MLWMNLCLHCHSPSSQPRPAHFFHDLRRHRPDPPQDDAGRDPGGGQARRAADRAAPRLPGQGARLQAPAGRQAVPDGRHRAPAGGRRPLGRHRGRAPDAAAPGHRRRLRLGRSRNRHRRQDPPLQATSSASSATTTCARCRTTWRRSTSACASRTPTWSRSPSRAQQPADNLRVLDLLRNAAKPTVAFCMGDLGMPSRILGAKYGAPFTYAAFNKERGIAPGMPSFDELKQVYHYDAHQRRHDGLRRHRRSGRPQPQPADPQRGLPQARHQRGLPAVPRAARRAAGVPQGVRRACRCAATA